MTTFSYVASLFSLLYVGLIVLGIYIVILFIQVARRAIKALDIYIKNHDDNHTGT